MVRTLVLDRYAREDLDKNHPHYEDFVRNWMPNMVDRAKMYILKEHLPKEKIIPDKCPHMQCGYEHKKFYIIFSGKIFAKPWFLGGLYEDNMTYCIESKITIKLLFQGYFYSKNICQI